MNRFNPLLYSSCLLVPERIAPSHWYQHVPFAFAAIEMLQPRVIVELGVFTGVSYCAMCQAVQHLGLATRAYGVDTWKGDPHNGANGPEILEDLKAYHDPRYGGFSQLVPHTFDDALAHFEDGSIDLLHIDGYHTYEQVRHDFEAWLPKMSSQGVVLLHDTNVRQFDFGVWKLLDEVKGKYPSFEFLHEHGLGVVAVGPSVPAALQPLLALRGAELTQVREYFFRLGQQITQRVQLRHEVEARESALADRDRQAAELRAEVAVHQSRVALMEQAVRELRLDLEEAHDRAHQLQREVQSGQQDLYAARCQVHDARAWLSDARQEGLTLRVALDASRELCQRLREQYEPVQTELESIKSSLAYRSARKLSLWSERLAPRQSARRRALHLVRRILSVLRREGGKGFAARAVNKLFKKTA